MDLAAYPDHSIMVQLHRTNMLFGLNPMDAAIPTRCKHAMTCIVWTGLQESVELSTIIHRVVLAQCCHTFISCFQVSELHVVTSRFFLLFGTLVSTSKWDLQL